jgi:DNA-binding phage protein
MGKKWNVFLSLATIADELRDFVEVLRDLTDALRQVSKDLKEERIHREAIYKLLKEDAIRDKL